MTRREIALTEKGYTYVKGVDAYEDAKAYAARMRNNGYKATVLTETRNGVPYYSVWAKQ